ncbi:hypothetical protein BTV20_07415 [Histophilus somni]|uniref:hypothetical protein n=2 Tax=Histophilus somni TaxID=731 RepID=UPI00094B1FE0|nr:hypothetical protein [Histophilus somni]ARU65258.1 hypothetical protein BTV18_06975 [Histophilus somni]ARU67123.1 hypothetical protein BTV19_07405 [Histophilus somni]ARU70879.1 hypothetical protein BTV20_07415 [Histophilus somni]ARU73761.1 hypothetical protein BTV22_02615 [Histophilus somni]ARU75559.1 hypothetical protein BTV21_02640 [Histophilus somni]
MERCYSTGKMQLNSTEAPNASTILLVASDSKLDASADTASADISRETVPLCLALQIWCIKMQWHSRLYIFLGIK